MALTPDQFNQFMANPSVRDAFMRDVFLGQKQQEAEQEMTLRAQEAQRQQEAHQAQMEAYKQEGAKRQHDLDLADVLQTSSGDMNAWVAPQQFNGQSNPYRVEFSKTPAEYQQHLQDAYGNKVPISEIAQRHNQQVQSLTGDYSVGAPQGLAPLTATLGKDGMQVQYSAKDPNQHKPMEAEIKAGGFYTTMKRAENDIESLERKGLKPYEGGFSNRWNESGYIPNEFKNDDYKTYTAAREQWIQAATHMMSGAGVNPTEAKRKAEAMFPTPGSGVEVHNQQKQARKEFMDYWGDIARKAGVISDDPFEASSRVASASIDLTGNQTAVNALPPGSKFIWNGKTYTKK